MNIDRKLNQKAVYWGSPVNDGAGSYTFASPVEIDCRWEDKQELFIDLSGKEMLSAAVVYVNQDLDMGGWLYEGEEATLDSSHDDPQLIVNAFEIRGKNKSPNVKAIQTLRKIWLTRLRSR